MDPPATKPIACRVLDRAAAESKGALAPVPLTLIQTGTNLGFAGGCNVGARHALAQGVDFIWFLNNDTLVDPAVCIICSNTSARPEIALCGSTLSALHTPQRIVALGGARLHPPTGTTGHVGEGLAWPAPHELIEQAESAMDYVVGVHARPPRLHRNGGLMAEDYFLYYEELDWAQRLPAHMRLGYAPASVVYHVEGGTIHGLLLPYYYRSLLRFNWRHTRRNFPRVLGPCCCTFPRPCWLATGTNCVRWRRCCCRAGCRKGRHGDGRYVSCVQGDALRRADAVTPITMP